MEIERVLILDADDTLWENNVFYERATDEFADRMTREGFDWHQARQTFSQIEHERVSQVGYAPQEFAASMVITYRHMCRQRGQPSIPAVERQVQAIGEQVLEYPITLLEGVAETLPKLRRYCRLILLTKGDPTTQQSKVDRSGLAIYFEAVHIVLEKGFEILRDLMERYELDPLRTWMVGNSPRSDINPALEAGIGAIYIPYRMPWAFEEAPLLEPDRVTTLQRFSELLELFPEPKELP